MLLFFAIIVLSVPIFGYLFAYNAAKDEVVKMFKTTVKYLVLNVAFQTVFFLFLYFFAHSALPIIIPMFAVLDLICFFGLSAMFVFLGYFILYQVIKNYSALKQYH